MPAWVAGEGDLHHDGYTFFRYQRPHLGLNVIPFGLESTTG